MNYIVYDQSGNIVKTGVCPSKMVHLQARLGEIVMEGIASDIVHKIVGGEIVEMSPTEKSIKIGADNNLVRNKMNEILRR